MITFLNAANRNTKEVVAEHFLRAAAVYSPPSRIRVDHGGENNDICLLMEVLRGPDRGSFIRGRSVHNQRIERAWVDIWNGVTNIYYDLFYFMESKDYLDVENEVHMWALHYIFLPRLNRDLQQFRSQWNHHGLRTEHNQTPAQLFVSHSLRLCNSNLTAMQDLFQSDQDQQQRSVQADSDNQAENDAEGIFSADWHVEGITHVDAISCPLSPAQLQHLQDTISPLDDSQGEYGVEIYYKVLQIVFSCI